MLSRAIVRQKPLFFKSKCEEMRILAPIYAHNARIRTPCRFLASTRGDQRIMILAPEPQGASPRK